MEHIFTLFRNLEKGLLVFKGLLPYILKYYARLLLFDNLLVIILLNCHNLRNWNKISKYGTKYDICGVI